MAAGIVNIPLGITNCYLIRGNNYIMVDTGPPGRQSRFLKFLIRKNIDPAHGKPFSAKLLEKGFTRN